VGHIVHLYTNDTLITGNERRAGKHNLVRHWLYYINRGRLPCSWLE